MPDYKSMYFHLAGNLANAIEALDRLSENLKEAQREDEKSFVEGDESVKNE